MVPTFVFQSTVWQEAIEKRMLGSTTLTLVSIYYLDITELSGMPLPVQRGLQALPARQSGEPAT